MTLDLTSLGFTKEELQEKVIQKICDEMLTSKGYDDEDESEYSYKSEFQNKILNAITKKIDSKVSEYCASKIDPNVAQLIENTVFQKTSEWGEKKGSPVTLTEYLTERAESYLLEKVDDYGKTKTESGGSYWRESQTRITHLVDKQLKNVIETGMKEATKSVYSVLSTALTETAKLKMQEVAKTLKFDIKGT